ncbi:holo-ACP synthase [Rathayibacter toxicus]|uniref:Holo-[acyl-carrier-protein] synthase n=1 Tax=Rathayibacter toxicus TaxID=145458 RepID=A0A0C5B8P9_9MICO|nr:holo-ACP synthase [Rathayibacter toxicus]AJM77198.1 4'-phosphopantetheinyl transferase [Rathayibacter toxicus]ALS56952.1 4'-phosphopantetheinyl transferase [Rathayibacter toxicus]KKM46216.1 4'-phosphopantetheinyl transferase [Rathayibacter toxicus]PPG23174.1 holo-ACP synthase [Rathayibacter toxicus]PPG47757.1 holo-ACP synthase [Rathayibacter toxicus]
MIIGIGVDVVDLARFERAIHRTPRLRERLFAESERQLPLASLAARFAAKEALIKAFGGAAGARWCDLVVECDEHGRPSFALYGAAREAARSRGIARLHVSMTHDAGVACAFVVAES